MEKGRGRRKRIPGSSLLQLPYFGFSHIAPYRLRGACYVNECKRNQERRLNVIHGIPTVIAVDFDGTLCRSEWPSIGKPNKVMIHSLIDRKKYGDKIILWTCREGKLLDEAVSWCKSFGLTFDAINENLPEYIEKYGNNPRKIHADLYIDDKSVKPLRDYRESGLRYKAKK